MALLVPCDALACVGCLKNRISELAISGLRTAVNLFGHRAARPPGARRRPTTDRTHARAGRAHRAESLADRVFRRSRCLDVHVVQPQRAKRLNKPQAVVQSEMVRTVAVGSCRLPLVRQVDPRPGVVGLMR